MHDSAHTQTHLELIIGAAIRQLSADECICHHQRQGRGAAREEIYYGKRKQEHGGERRELRVTTKSETRRRNYIFMYKTGRCRGLHTKRFREDFEGERQRTGNRTESELVSDIWVPGRASV